MGIIKFENQEFIVKEINLHSFGRVNISTTSLNAMLINEKGIYKSQEAKHIDEEIFFFIEDDQIKFSNKKLKAFLMDELSLIGK